MTGQQDGRARGGQDQARPRGGGSRPGQAVGRAARVVARTAIDALPARVRQPVRRALGLVAPWEPGARLRPPRCPPGWVVAPPDFVGVGAQKAGTTWWYELLTRHPGIYDNPAAHKERHFFMRFFDAGFGPADVAEYHRWFPRPPGQLTGEWTPDYMLHFWIPRLLQQAAPDAKVLVLLRDPVERIVSGMTHVAVRQAVPDARAATEAYMRGLYGAQLDLLTRHVDPGRVLVQQFERCRCDPVVELGRTFAFLGLEPMDPDLVDPTPVNLTRATKVALPDGMREDLAALYRPDVERLLSAYPQVDASLWPNFRFLAD